MEKKTRFKLRFADKDRMSDWEFILHTTEPKTEDDIVNLVMYWAEVNSHNFDDYLPADIINDLCEDEGWTWEDAERDAISFHYW